jgi:hypothetical protein
MKELAAKISQLKNTSPANKVKNLERFDKARSIVLQALQTAYWTPILPGDCEYLKVT